MTHPEIALARRNALAEIATNDLKIKERLTFYLTLEEGTIEDLIGKMMADEKLAETIGQNYLLRKTLADLA